MTNTPGSRTRRPFEIAGAIVMSLAILILPNIAAVSTLVSDAIDQIVPGEPNNPSDFDFQSFDADYALSRDADGRSALSTTETLVAQFPDDDQNTGIVRRIPNFYQGHSTHVRVLSVTDLAGDPLDHTIDPTGDYTSIRITDGSYLHGETSFVVSYDQSDVTSFYTDDEFFWDVNGVGWAQAFGVVRATITIDPSLAETLNNNLYCYTGEQGESSANCTISRGDVSGSPVISVDSTSAGGFSRLDDRENLTVAVGFEPGTFTPAPLDIPARIASAWFWLGGLSTLGPVITALGFLALAYAWKWNERRMSRPSATIIAQYAPPQRISVAQAAYLLNTRQAKKRAFAADTVDQVVRKKLVLDRRGSDYTVRLATTAEPKATERLTTRSAYRAVLANDNRSRQIGAVVVEKGNMPLRLAFGALRVRILSSVSDSFTSTPQWVDARRVLAVATVLGALLAFTVYGPRTGGNASANLVLLWGPITIAAPIFALILLFRVHLPTANTLSVLRELEGLRVYIQLAEQDRMRLLQSPENAEFAVVDNREVVALNERLLGYAVLFGLEKRWAAEIGVSSTTASPDAVADLVSSASIASLVAAVASTTPQTPPSSSSGTSSSNDSSGGGGYSGSSGGSDGGGSSGDGGGGGGGDGI